MLLNLPVKGVNYASIQMALKFTTGRMCGFGMNVLPMLSHYAIDVTESFTGYLTRKTMNKIDEGYFRVYRSLFGDDDTFWNEYRERTRWEAWLDLINLARYKKEPQKVLIGNKVIICNRGELLRSVKNLSERWRWSIMRTRGFLNLLETGEMIQRHNDIVTTRITIVNYSKYQDQQQPNNNDTTTTQQPCNNDATTEEGKRIKEIKEKYRGFARFNFNVKRLETLFLKFKTMRPDINFELELDTASDWFLADSPNARKKKDLILTLNNWFKDKCERIPLPHPRELRDETPQETEDRLNALVPRLDKQGNIEYVSPDEK